MYSKEEIAEKRIDAETLASTFLTEYFKDKEMVYPINPFQVLTDVGIPFTFRVFKSYEGIYIPAENSEDINIVAININRPIQRQRFTAAHELCHHLKDGKGTMCPIKGKNGIENYADSFAAALLMPLFEIKNQARRYKSGKFVSFSDALSIADYFGVSFQSCVLRLAYVLKVIDGDTEIGVLNKRIRSFSPSKKRTKQGLYDNYLYKTLIDALYPWIVIPENAHIKLKFENDYIYNDSRIEGIEIEKEKLAEIVTDIRLKGSKSDYCDYTHEAEISIAGHAEMYERVFSWPREKDISAFATLGLNQLLFSKAPEPDYGGRIRQSNTLVIGAKFETVDFADIPLKLAELNIHVKDLLEKIDILTPSQFIERSVRIHHQLTVIHPFPDGNGRTSRAFLNLLLSRKGLPAIYIKTEGKDKYLSALSIADENSEFAFLEIEICKAILRSICELSDYSILH